MVFDQMNKLNLHTYSAYYWWSSEMLSLCMCDGESWLDWRGSEILAKIKSWMYSEDISRDSL